ncbi:ABCB family ABC transporter ATP-binding protein/permease [Massilia norwichensis]|uniref:ABC transporter ATP-binding protein/permease n=1 Tax=Massilia norwichensis TaxID=1442366 RepID=A0ABT2A0M0_9BURK|nr:ABC transporter ATP-binding protein/permease [Massilia norwichensis]MCS0587723.1 ABC transporter ATP-binding protein/permease [Massilia norwichensis]
MAHDPDIAGNPDEPDPPGPRRPFAAELWAVTRHYRWRIAASVLLLIVAKIATVAVPLVLKRIIDAFSQPALPAQLPIYLLAGYALLRFASTLFNEWRDLLFARVTLSTVSNFAQKTFAHLHALGPRFHARRQVGSLLPDIDRGTNGIAFLLGVGLFTIVPTLVEIGLVLAVMLRRYHPGFSSIIVLTFLAYVGFTLVFTARRVVYQRRVNKLDSRAKGQLADSLINADTVKYFGNEAFESRKFASIMDGWLEAGVGNQRALFTLHVGQSFVIAIGVAAIMLFAGQAVMQHRMSVGDLVLINAYALQVCLPLNALGFVYREARDARVNAERLFGLLRERPEMPDPPDAPVLHPGAGEVVFEHVSFHYDPERPVLFDVSFRIPPGTTLAVVGRSGSGKSTLARLLLRLYDPNTGRVLIDGQDIRHRSPSSVRRAIGVVPQDAALFNDTIGNNIAYARIDADREEVVAAARAAQLDGLISALPEGYDSPVGERGVMFSGGERQRIGIARAILKNPPILIFDEATSALDSVSEHAITQELERLARNRSTLIIAHRLSTIVNADAIIVMENGRIVERGTHAELLEQEGAYAQLWLLQQRMAQAP